MIDELFGSDTWGLHDASLAALRVDWVARTLELDVRVRIGERAARVRSARVVCTGLVFLALDSERTIEWRESGLWVDGSDGEAARAPPNPPLPEGCTPAWLYVREWNGFIRFAAVSASLVWLEPFDRPLHE